jgi:hypothetical protein
MDTLTVVTRSLREKREDGLARTVEHVIHSLNLASVDLLIAQKRGIESIRNESVEELIVK